MKRLAAARELSRRTGAHHDDDDARSLLEHMDIDAKLLDDKANEKYGKPYDDLKPDEKRRVERATRR